MLITCFYTTGTAGSRSLKVLT